MFAFYRPVCLQQRAEAVCVSAVQMTEYFSVLLVLHSRVSDILKKETLFTWAGEGLPQPGNLHIITDLTAWRV